MAPRTLNIWSPVAALAVVWISLQSVGFADEPNPTEPLLDPPASMAASQLLPELEAVSEILATTSSVALGESVPDTVRAILIDQGAVLLLPDRHVVGGAQ